MTIEGEGAAVGGDNVVDDADEGGLSGTIGTKEAKHCASAHMEVDVVEGVEGAVGFGYFVDD